MKEANKIKSEKKEAEFWDQHSAADIKGTKEVKCLDLSSRLKEEIIERHEKKKKLVNVTLSKYQRLYGKKEYGEVAKELAKTHQKNSAFLCDLIVGYIKEEPDPEFYMLEVENNPLSVLTERLIPYRFTPSSIFPAPSVVIPCSWEELEAAVRDKDSLLRPFIAKGEVYVGNSEAKGRWERLSSQFRGPKKI